MMRNLVRRLKQLETGRADATINLKSQRIAEVILERRRRRLAQSGIPVEEVRRPEPAPGPRMSMAETLRFHRAARLRGHQLERWPE